MSKRTLNNFNFFDDTPIVACSLQIGVLEIQTPSFAVVTPLCNLNQVDPTQFIITNRVRCNTKYPGAPSVYSMPMAYSRRFVGYSLHPALNKGPSVMILCSPVFLLKRFQIFGFCGNIYLPAPPLSISHISPVSAFISKLKPSLLACSATSSPMTLLHAARPRLSRQVIHTRPPSSSYFHIPHAPTVGASATASTQITNPSTK